MDNPTPKAVYNRSTRQLCVNTEGCEPNLTVPWTDSEDALPGFISTFGIGPDELVVED